MPDEISPESFDRLAELAAFDLNPPEREYLRRQLNNQLRAIRELERIELPPDLPPAAHGVTFTPEIRPPLRDDVPVLDSELAERILKQAPEVDERYFVVPEIAAETL